MKFQIFLSFIFYSCLTSTFVRGEWSPECLKQNKNLSILQTQKYTTLQKSMIKYLEGSWSSPEKTTLLMDLVVLTKPLVCVEIGAFTGWSVLPVATALKYNNQGKIYAIDAWSNKEAIYGLKESDPNKEWWSSLNMTDIYNTYIHHITHWQVQSRCVTLNLPSKNAVYQLPMIDFLHIDGNYSNEISYEDVILYLPKVNIGGYILFSNIFWSVDNKITRMRAFSKLLENCEIVTFIDNRSTCLLRKIF